MEISFVNVDLPALETGSGHGNTHDIACSRPLAHGFIHVRVVFQDGGNDSTDETVRVELGLGLGLGSSLSKQCSARCHCPLPSQ